MGSMSTKHPRAKYGEAVKECVEVDVVDLRMWQSWLYELADPELTAVYAEMRVRTRSARPAVSSEMVFATRS